MEIKIFDLDGKFELDGRFVNGKLCRCEFEWDYLDEEKFKHGSDKAHIYNNFTSIQDDIGIVYWVVLDCPDNAKIKKTLKTFVFKGLDECLNPIIRSIVEEMVCKNEQNLIYGFVCNQYQQYGEFDVENFKKEVKSYLD